MDRGAWSLQTVGSHRVGHDWATEPADTAHMLTVRPDADFEFHLLLFSRTILSNSLQHHGRCSPPGSSIHRILQARILELAAIFSSRRSFWPRNRTWVPCLAGGFFTTEPVGKPVGSINFSKEGRSVTALNTQAQDWRYPDWNKQTNKIEF